MSKIKEITENIQLIYNKKFQIFGLNDIIKYRQIEQKNLFEMISQYPSKGINFKIFKKQWPEDTYYIIRDVQLKGQRHGKIYGVQYYRGKKIDEYPVKIKGCNKRGLWRYQINNSSVELDNGLFYTSEDMQKMYSQKGLDKKLPYKENRQKQLEELDKKFYLEGFGVQV